ncbi:MAG: hypothetical protein HY543_01985 [Deltaproteobacteria bacterium]|nr:hypothetical protein [Deltaproteobacteria bacterium]
MEFPKVRPDIIRWEMRAVTGETIESQQQRKPGGFARFLSGIGRFLGAVAAPLSFLFPPAALGAAAAYGVSRLGDTMQMRSYQKMMEKQSQGQPAGPMFLPGLEQATYDLQKESPLTMSITKQDQRVLDVLFARNDLMLESAQAMKGKMV